MPVQEPHCPWRPEQGQKALSSGKTAGGRRGAGGGDWLQSQLSRLQLSLSSSSHPDLTPLHPPVSLFLTPFIIAPSSSFLLFFLISSFSITFFISSNTSLSTYLLDLEPLRVEEEPG